MYDPRMSSTGGMGAQQQGYRTGPANPSSGMLQDGQPADQAMVMNALMPPGRAMMQNMGDFRSQMQDWRTQRPSFMDYFQQQFPDGLNVQAGQNGGFSFNGGGDLRSILSGYQTALHGWLDQRPKFNFQAAPPSVPPMSAPNIAPPGA